MNDMLESGALISDDGRYRFRLWRVWNHASPRVTWVMLNPSTADSTTDDATIRKCVGFSARNGFGGLEVVNLVAYRATDPKELARADGAGEQILGDADQENAVIRATSTDRIIIVAWGAIPRRARRVQAFSLAMRARLRGRDVRCLGWTKAGEPRHPLMLPYVTRLVGAVGAQ